MGWFNFGGDQASNSFPWQRIQTREELAAAWRNASEKPALFFKHSTRCNISAMALNRLENSGVLSADHLDLYFIDLIAHRDVSNELAVKSGVAHQSPQAIVVKNAEVVYHASHGGIDAKEIIDSIE
jgi:bacillithiol system protein YtxJ